MHSLMPAISDGLYGELDHSCATSDYKLRYRLLYFKDLKQNNYRSTLTVTFAERKVEKVS